LQLQNLMENGTIRVLIADDHPLIREGLKMILERDGLEVIGAATTGRQTIEMALSLEPDVVVLDIVMPDMDGLQALAAIKSARSATCVIIHTAYSKPEYLTRAISLGASGFLAKDCDLESIPLAIRAVARGEAIVGQELLRSALRALSASTHSAWVAQETDSPELTPQELRILTLMAEGLGNAAIGEALCVSTNTVKSHVKSLLAKLGASDRTQAVAWGMRKGLIP
jgi:DNA-binding NarL/FixJ family response regulator